MKGFSGEFTITKTVVVIGREYSFVSIASTIASKEKQKVCGLILSTCSVI
jgi:hypothetical protein